MGLIRLATIYAPMVLMETHNLKVVFQNVLKLLQKQFMQHMVCLLMVIFAQKFVVHLIMHLREHANVLLCALLGIIETQKIMEMELN